MGEVLSILILVLAVVTVVALLRALRSTFDGKPLLRRVVVPEWQACLLYRDGVFERELPPGACWLGPRSREVFVSRREMTFSTAAQEVLSADTLQAKMVAIVSYRIADPRLAFESVAAGNDAAPSFAFHTGVQAALYRDAQLVLRNLAAERSLAQLLSERKALDAALLERLIPLAGRYGVEILAADIRDVILAGDMRRLYAEKERVRVEGETALERARSEQAVLRSLANAARLMKDNPDLATLRLLQALNPAPGSPSPTIVLGAPPPVLVPVQPRRGDGASRRAAPRSEPEPT